MQVLGMDFDVESCLNVRKPGIDIIQKNTNNKVGRANLSLSGHYFLLFYKGLYSAILRIRAGKTLIRSFLFFN